MKKGRLVLLIIAAVVLVTSTIFYASTGEVFYDLEPDNSDYNADPTDTHTRPFIVDKEEYPFESNWFESDGVAMHYIDEGEGIPIILCHGNPEWSFIYRNLIKEMSSESRVIAYDLPGFGFSEVPEDFNYTPQEYSKWIEALVIEHLELDEFIIVVQDWGGPTGLSVAVNHPDKVAGVVISNTWAWEAVGTPKAYSTFMNIAPMKRMVINQNYVTENMLDGMLPSNLVDNKAIRDAYNNQFPTPESREKIVVLAKHINEQSEWLNELEGKLVNLEDKPIEFIFGTKDPLLGTEAVRERWNGHFPEANVQLLPDANHFTQEDSPESYAIALRNILSLLED